MKYWLMLVPLIPLIILIVIIRLTGKIIMKPALLIGSVFCYCDEYISGSTHTYLRYIHDKRKLDK